MTTRFRGGRAAAAARVRRAVTARLPMPITHQAPVRTADPPPVVRRRRAVVTGTCVLGAGVLGASLSAPPNSPRFYVLTLSAAGTWLVGGFAQYERYYVPVLGGPQREVAGGLQVTFWPREWRAGR